LKDLAPQSFGYTVPGTSIARSMQNEIRSFHHCNCTFFRKSKRALTAVTNAVLNRSPQNIVIRRRVSGETWALDNYVLLSLEFVFKDKTRPFMMYGCIRQIQEFLAVKERVKVKVLKSATDFEVTYENTYDLENLSLNRDVARDRSLCENHNLHSNGRPYSKYSNNPAFVHPYFSTPIVLSE